jgi:hypothetical protein
MSKKPARSKLVAVARPLLTVAAVGFLVYYLFRYSRQLPPIDLKASAPSLLLGLAGVTVLRLFLAGLWSGVIGIFCVRIELLKALNIHTRAMLARYIPGNVWHAFSMATWCEREGIPARTVFAAWCLENAFTVLAGAMVALSLSFTWIAGVESRSLRALSIICIAGIAIVHPKLFSSLLSFPLKMLKREPIAIPSTFARNAGLLCLYSLWFVGHGLVLCALSYAFGNGAVLTPLTAIGIFSASWTIGFISFLTPSGLGVREALMTALIAAHVPYGVAVLLPLVMRVLMTISEASAVLVVYIAERIVGPARREPSAVAVTTFESS